MVERVAIVNRTNLINFGSLLQVYALQEAITSLGYDCEVIWEKGTVNRHFDFRLRKLIRIALRLIFHPSLLKGVWTDFHTVTSSPPDAEIVNKFEKFAETKIKRRFLTHSEFAYIGKQTEFKAFVCGSDQVWCSTTLYPDPLMYLRFAPESKRISYAPSIGRDFIPGYNKRIMRRYVKEIPAVSVRELEGAVLIEQLTGRRAEVTADPTLLFGKNFWTKQAVMPDEQGYILCYFLTEPSHEVQHNIARQAGDRKIVVLGCPLSHIASMGNYEFPKDGPAEFIGHVYKCSFMFTDSYHGMLFALNLEKEFLSVERIYGKYDQSTRQRHILAALGMEDRLQKDAHIPEKAIDYPTVRTRIEHMRETSLSFLSKSLKQI